MSGLFKKKRSFHSEPQQPANVIVAPVPRPLEPPVAFVVPSPVPAPQSPAEPVPAPRAKAWPYGAHEFAPGAWYVGAAGPFSKPEEYWDLVLRVQERDANLQEADAARDATSYLGLFPAAAFIHGPGEGAEAAFIYAASRLYRERRGGGDLYRDEGLFAGTFADINRLINYGEQEQIFLHKGYEQTVADFPDTQIKRAILSKLE